MQEVTGAKGRVTRSDGSTRRGRDLERINSDVQVQVQVGLLQALLPLARHIEIANKSSPLLNSLYFLSSCGYEAEFYRDRHTPNLLLYPGLRPALMSPLRSGNKQRCE